MVAAVVDVGLRRGSRADVSTVTSGVAERSCRSAGSLRVEAQGLHDPAASRTRAGPPRARGRPAPPQSARASWPSVSSQATSGPRPWRTRRVPGRRARCRFRAAPRRLLDERGLGSRAAHAQRRAGGAVQGQAQDARLARGQLEGLARGQEPEPPRHRLDGEAPRARLGVEQGEGGRLRVDRLARRPRRWRTRFRPPRPARARRPCRGRGPGAAAWLPRAARRPRPRDLRGGRRSPPGRAAARRLRAGLRASSVASPDGPLPGDRRGAAAKTSASGFLDLQSDGHREAGPHGHRPVAEGSRPSRCSPMPEPGLQRTGARPHQQRARRRGQLDGHRPPRRHLDRRGCRLGSEHDALGAERLGRASSVTTKSRRSGAATRPFVAGRHAPAPGSAEAQARRLAHAPEARAGPARPRRPRWARAGRPRPQAGSRGAGRSRSRGARSRPTTASRAWRHAGPPTRAAGAGGSLAASGTSSRTSRPVAEPSDDPGVAMLAPPGRGPRCPRSGPGPGAGRPGSPKREDERAAARDSPRGRRGGRAAGFSSSRGTRRRTDVVPAAAPTGSTRRR